MKGGYLLDANILIYAFRGDAPQHELCHAWLKDVLIRGERVIAPGVVELAFLRITTLPQLGPSAAPLSEAFSFLHAVRAAGCTRIEPGSDHTAHFERLCTRHDLQGNDVNDAYLAALAIEQAATLVSSDYGFARFPEVVWMDPLDPTL